MPLFQGYGYTDAGVAVSGATVNLYDKGTTTPVRATTTTDANGLYTINHATEGRFDVELVNGTSKRRVKYDEARQYEEIETAVLKVRNPADTFVYNIVPAAITAARTLNLPLITGTDTLASLGLAQTFTGVQTFNGSALKLNNPANTFAYTIVPGAIAAARNLTLPLLTGDDTFVTRDSGGALYKLFIGDTSNATMDWGLTINQSSSVNEALAIKASATVAHGMTSVTETDTYFFIDQPNASADGGARLTGIRDSVTLTGGLILRGIDVTETATKSVAASATVLIDCGLKSGTGTVALSANANILAVGNPAGAATRFILDADGDSHQDTGTAWTNFDAEDDIKLLNTLTAHVTRQGDPLRQNFGRWLEESREPLERLKIVTFNEDQHHFINWSRTNMLVIGAVRQLAVRLEQVETALALVGPSGGSKVLP